MNKKGERPEVSFARRHVRYRPESVPVSCTSCGATAVCEVLGVECGLYGGHWIRLPQGWWTALGLTIGEVKENKGAGGVRCPKCFAQLSLLVGGTTQP
jgi:hypothetical protein